MDTGTHIVMGVALGGLATLDPVVQNDPALYQAVAIGTLAGSLAPDFDTILKLKNNAVYIRNHRGITHTLPAVLLWGILLSGLIYTFIPGVNLLHLWLWTFGAVILHVFVDIFNAYGTQAYRPFTRRWVAYGFINTFDPYIFAIHIVGIVGVMLLGARPGLTWLVIYFIILLYYIKRYIDKREILKKIHQEVPHVEEVATSPTIRHNFWRVAITAKNKYYVGKVENGHIELVDEFKKIPLPENELTDIAKRDENISAFLSFSPVYRWEINYYDDFTELRLIDLRYRNNDHYPFVAVVQIDDNMRIMSSYTGWVFSESKLQNKLVIEDSPAPFS